MCVRPQLKKIGRKYKEQSEATQKDLDQVKATSAGQQTQQFTAAAASELANKQMVDRMDAIETERDEVRAKVTQKDAEVASLKERVQNIQQVSFQFPGSGPVLIGRQFRLVQLSSAQLKLSQVP